MPIKRSLSRQNINVHPSIGLMNHFYLQQAEKLPGPIPLSRIIHPFVKPKEFNFSKS